MENLDLNLNNYSKTDLEKFFKLPKKYDKHVLEEKEYLIRTTLLQSGMVKKELKRDLISFLEEGKKYLLSFLKNNEKRPTLLSKEYNPDKLDEINHIESRNPELIQKEPKSFIYTNNSDYFPGELNPLNNRILTKCLNIDTRFRGSLVNTQSSDFTFQLSSRLNKIVSMELSNIEMPLTFYGISSTNGNNFLYIRVNYTNKNDVIIEAERIFTVPDGNYTSFSLIEKLNSLISPRNDNNELLFPDLIFSYLRFAVDLKIDGSGSGKVTLGPYPDCLYTFHKVFLDFTRDIKGQTDNVHITQKLGYNLGFIKPKYEDNFFYESESIINTNIQRYIYLAIDDFNKNTNNQFISIFNESILNNDILARISIEGSHYNEIQKNKMTYISVPREYFGPVDIQRIRVRLFDEYGKILNTNNTNFSFCLTLKMIYDL